MLKSKYNSDETRLREAVCLLQQKHDDILSGKCDCLRWMDHFKRFEGLVELDRRTVINLIQSIRIISKTELQITFNYQDEIVKAASILQKEAA
jgi:hypothetical protein